MERRVITKESGDKWKHITNNLGMKAEKGRKKYGSNLIMTSHKLSGPVSLSYLTSKKYNKNILLLGDMHFSRKGSCRGKSKDIIKFLDEIFTSDDKKIDFFLENQYHHLNPEIPFGKVLEDDSLPDDFLNSIREYYLNKGCFQIEKKYCKKEYPNTRFHNADYRETSEKQCKEMAEITTQLIYKVFYEKFTILNINSKIKKLKNDEKFMKVFDKVNTYSKMKKVMEKILKCKKIKKQLDNCPKNIRSKILDFNEKLYSGTIETTQGSVSVEKTYDLSFSQLESVLKGKNKYSRSGTIKLLNSVGVLIMDYLALKVMDIYTVARIMKKDEYKNIVIYAGHTHIQNYEDFFKKRLTFTESFTGRNISKRCIDVTGLELF